MWWCWNPFHRMPVGVSTGGIAVVIDVLRASTTIVTALEHGSSGIRTTTSISSAIVEANRCHPRALLGGEREGVLIEGFDLGNSPSEYSRLAVENRSIVMTTTNGTAALDHCQQSAEVFLGAMINRRAVANTVELLSQRMEPFDVHLVCAGTDGEPSDEDELTAGGILAAWLSHTVHHDISALSQTARHALNRFNALFSSDSSREMGHSIESAFRITLGGQRLTQLGFERDIRSASAIDSSTLSPRWDRQRNLIVAR